MGDKSSKNVHIDEPNHTQRFTDIAEEPCEMLMPIQGYENMPLVTLEEAVEPIVLLSPDVKRMVYVAKKKCAQISAGQLSIDESASIMLYSMEWEPQEKCLYFALNATLRSKNRQILKPWFLYLKLIITALSRLPSKHSFVCRGIKRDMRKEYQKGETIIWWGFSSCTSTINVLENEQFLGSTGTRTLFIIECDTGKDIRQYSSIQKEDEILLLPGRLFKVVSDLNVGNDLYIIQLKEIESPFPLIEPVPVMNALTPLHVNLIDEKSQTNQIPDATSVSTTIEPGYRNQRLEKYIIQVEPGSVLDLSSQYLTDLDMYIVVAQAIISKQCTEIDLKNNDITSFGGLILANALQNETTLLKLSLDINCVFDMGARLLASALSLKRSSLKRINLAANGITDEGAQCLAEMLMTNKTLVELGLSFNQISDRGVQLLANALAHYNSSLEELTLFSNKLISDLSVDPLIEMLTHNRTLKEFWLSDCNLSTTGKAKLRKSGKSKENFELCL